MSEPQKYPGFGAKCNGCGLCCLVAPCDVADRYGLWTRGCAALVKESDRYRCDALLNPSAYGIGESRTVIASMMGELIGCGFRAGWSVDGVRKVLRKYPLLSNNIQWPRRANYFYGAGLEHVIVRQSAPGAELTVEGSGVPLSRWRPTKRLPSWAVKLVISGLAIGLVLWVLLLS